VGWKGGGGLTVRRSLVDPSADEPETKSLLNEDRPENRGPNVQFSSSSSSGKHECEGGVADD
jgi:hypothetical protein